jgi:quercetin dioxygenase-like cupin family protein
MTDDVPSVLPVQKSDAATLARMESALLELPQVVAPLTHHFAPGVYMREVCMPAGAIILGHEHTTEHFNIVLTGSARVLIDGKLSFIKAPCVFSSGVGVRKALLIEEEMRWMTVHPTDETDLGKLEETLIKKSEVFTDFHRLKSELNKELK